MAWVDYTRQDDGRLRLVDDQGGELLAVPTPSVQQMTAEIDARKANALATPAPMPDPIVTAQSAPQSMQLDQVGPPVTPAVPAAGGGGGGNPFAPPAPLVNVARPPAATRSRPRRRWLTSRRPWVATRSCRWPRQPPRLRPQRPHPRPQPRQRRLPGPSCAPAVAWAA